MKIDWHEVEKAQARQREQDKRYAELPIICELGNLLFIVFGCALAIVIVGMFVVMATHGWLLVAILAVWESLKAIFGR